MGIQATRRQHSRAGRHGSYLTGARWAVLAPFQPSVAGRGCRRAYATREIVHTISEVLRGGIGWWSMPCSFPLWRTVYRWIARLRDDGSGEPVQLQPGHRRPRRP